MEEKKWTYQAIIEGMDGGVIQSPILETLKKACKWIDQWVGEEGDSITEGRTKYAAIISRYYEGGLIQSETKRFFYEW